MDHKLDATDAQFQQFRQKISHRIFMAEVDPARGEVIRRAGRHACLQDGSRENGRPREELAESAASLV